MWNTSKSNKLDDVTIVFDELLFAFHSIDRVLHHKRKECIFSFVEKFVIVVQAHDHNDNVITTSSSNDLEHRT